MFLTGKACRHGLPETFIPTLPPTHSRSPDVEHCASAQRCCAYRAGRLASHLESKRSDVRRVAYTPSIPLLSLGTALAGHPIPAAYFDLPRFAYAAHADSPRCVHVHAYRRVFTANAVLTGLDPKVDGAPCAEPISTPNPAKFPSIPASKRVVLVRHGQSTWNAEGRIQGSSDFAVLTTKGEIQAETSRQMLLADAFHVCFCSPLARAKRTAEIIWGQRSDPMIPIDDLREIDLYGFQGLMKNEGKERYGNVYRTWQVDAANFLIDGHYPVRELWARARKCWEEILCHNGQSILVVAHNAVNQALVATATGLGPEYFRQLLQSNCGVSVLDFTPRSESLGPPYVCLDRLNQTPSPPVAGEQPSGRKALYRVILVCNGATEASLQNRFPFSRNETLNMLGIIQARKTAELLLDVKINLVLSSPQPTAVKTAEAIIEVQEAADCLGADCIPRYVDEKQLEELADLDWGQWKGKSPAEVVNDGRWQDVMQAEGIEGGESAWYFWNRAGRAWNTVLEHIKGSDESQAKNVVVVGHESMHTAMVGHCLGLSPTSIGTFHVDTGSLSVIDLPDGPTGRGVVRCLNYTAHLGRWAVPITLPTLGDEDF